MLPQSMLTDTPLSLRESDCLPPEGGPESAWGCPSGSQGTVCVRWYFHSLGHSGSEWGRLLVRADPLLGRAVIPHSLLAFDWKEQGSLLWA